jgi:hypothetical protein
MILSREVFRTYHPPSGHLPGQFARHYPLANHLRQEMLRKCREVKRCVSADLAIYSQVGGNYRQARRQGFYQRMSRGLHISRCDVEIARL